MKKKILVLVVVILLLALTIQVASAEPTNPPHNPNGGSCNMANSWWEPGEGPGNAYGVQPGERGMYHVHANHPSKGADNMGLIYEAHCLS